MQGWMTVLLINFFLLTQIYPLPPSQNPQLINSQEAIALALKAATGKSLFQQYLMVNFRQLKNSTAQVIFYSVDGQGKSVEAGRVVITKSELKTSVETSGFPLTQNSTTLDEYDLAVIKAYEYLTTKKVKLQDFDISTEKIKQSMKTGEFYDVFFIRIPFQFEAARLVKVKITISVSGL